MFVRLRLKQQGAVLFIVLAIMSALIMLAVNFSITLSRSSGMVLAQTEGVQARYSALSGIQYAMFATQDSDSEHRWMPNGKIYDLTLGDAKIWVSIMTSANKIDINFATKEMLTDVFTNFGVDATEASKIAANVIHWRNFGDSTDDTDSANDKDYEAAGLSIPEHRRFLVIEEIGKVLGVDSTLYAQLIPVITVFGDARVDITTAKPNVLTALGFTEEQLEQIKSAQDIFYKENGENPFPQELLFDNPHAGLNRGGRYFRIDSHAILYDSTVSTQYAILSFRKEKDRSYSIIESGSTSGEDKTNFLSRVAVVQAGE